MRATSVLQKLLRFQGVQIKDVAVELWDGEEVLVMAVRAYSRLSRRCPHCHRKCPGYDSKSTPRSWRHLDAMGMKCYVRASVVRVQCREHGVVTEDVPWARPKAKLTRHLEDMTAWLTTQSPMSSVAEFLRITWRTVASIIDRIVADATRTGDQLDGLRRIGIDEIAYRKGHRYLTVVIDHDTGRLVWAADGHDSKTLNAFFDALGPVRARELTHVSADAATWIASVVTNRAPQAIRCMDPFHVVQWITNAIDRTRTRVLSTIADLTTEDHRALRWAILKNPEKLTPTQRTVQQKILAKKNHELTRAYILKEQFRDIYTNPNNPDRKLQIWITDALASNIPEIVNTAHSIRKHTPEILNAIHHKLTNARTEATNTQLRAITTRARGFRTPQTLLTIATLDRSGIRPPLPY